MFSNETIEKPFCACVTVTGRTICLVRSLSKRWTETAIPVIVLLVVALAFSQAIPGFLLLTSLGDTARQAAEIGFVVLGMTFVMVWRHRPVGRLDLRADRCCDALSASNSGNGVSGTGRWPASGSPASPCGAINGFLVGFLRMRAFLTTLVTLIIYRSTFDVIFPQVSTPIVTSGAGFPDL